MSRTVQMVRALSVRTWDRLWSGVGIVLVSVAASWVFAMAGRIAGAGPAALAEGIGYNQVLLWWPGIGLLVTAAITTGAQSKVLLSLGADRATFYRAAVLHFVLLAGLAALSVLVLGLVEQLTDGWFQGLPLVNLVYFDHSPWRGAVTVFLLCLVTQAVGAFYATLYLWGGATLLTWSIIVPAVLMLLSFIMTATNTVTENGATLTFGKGAFWEALAGVPGWGWALVVALVAAALLALGRAVLERVSVR